MTSGIALSASSILGELEEIAGELDRPEMLQRIVDLQDYKRAPKMRILIAGLPGSGRSTLVNILLQRPGLLPESPIPKPPHSIDIRHGERVSAVRLSSDEAAAIPSDTLASLLKEPKSSNEERVEVHVPSELLEMCDLRVEMIDAQRPPATWRSVLGSTDYVMLVLNATALLSDMERRFLRDLLASQVGLQRVAIVVTHTDLIPEEERESIVGLLRTFLGPYESQPAILDLSLRAIARGGQSAPGYDALRTLLDDLVQQHEPIRAAAMHQLLQTILDEMDATAQEMHVIYSLREEDMQRARETLASQQTWLESRTKRMQGRVEAFVDTLLKERLLRRIEGFGDALRNRLPQELESIEDIGVIRRHLPGYLETVWTEFLRGQMIWVRGELAGEEARLNHLIESDLQELLEAVMPKGAELRRDLESDPFSFHVFISPKRGKHRATNVARGLSLHGFFMIFFAPQIGILSLAASQVVQRVYKEDITQADRRAVTASAVTATKELEREIKNQVQQQFATLTQQLKDSVSDVYRQNVEQIAALLRERTQHHQDLEQRRERIGAIVQERLPRLRASLDQLKPRESA